MNIEDFNHRSPEKLDSKYQKYIDQNSEIIKKYKKYFDKMDITNVSTLVYKYF